MSIEICIWLSGLLVTYPEGLYHLRWVLSSAGNRMRWGHVFLVTAFHLEHNFKDVLLVFNSRVWRCQCKGIFFAFLSGFSDLLPPDDCSMENGIRRYRATRLLMLGSVGHILFWSLCTCLMSRLFNSLHQLKPRLSWGNLYGACDSPTKVRITCV